MTFLLAPVLSALLLVLAFPTFDLGWLAWVGLVPLLVALSGRGALWSFSGAFLFGTLFITGVCRWIFEVQGIELSHYGIIVSFIAPWFGLFGLVFSVCAGRIGTSKAFLAAPFVWVSIEYVRSNVSFLSLPWGLMAHTQYQNTPVIQISSVTGAYGVSFLVVAVNAALGLAVLSFMGRGGMWRRTTSSKRPSGKATSAGLFAAAVALVLAVMYGQKAVSNGLEGEKLRVSVVQGNIAQEIKWDRKYATQILNKYGDLSRAAAKAGTDLIVWPEAATPGFVLNNSKLRSWMRSLVRETGKHYVIGSSEHPKLVEGKEQVKRTGNTALFYSPAGEPLGQYLKMRLVPFGEYLPYEHDIPWPEFITGDKGKNWDMPGDRFTLFPMRDSKFGVVICWESIFPGFFRRFVRDGAGLMFNITNEAWFRTTIPYQYLSMNVFRAVENRVYVLRAANIGISCIIDPFGRILGRVEKNGQDLYVEGFLTGDVTLSDRKTVYTKYGDVFAFICLFIAACALARALAVRAGSSDNRATF
jgi:apolipoprotein N-acyltransferase